MIATAPALTEQGKSLLMRAIGGEQITFTRFKVGSGSLGGQSADALTDLITPVLAFSITDMDDSQEGLLALTGEFDNEEVEADFTWRELGIFAKGEDNIEVLYAYSNDGENASIVRQLNTDVLTIQTVTMIIAIGEAENVTAVYSPHRQYALAEDLTSHTGNTQNPHSVTKQQVGLGNVPNLAPKDMTVAFTVAETRENITTGEKLSVMFGKIAKVITDVIAHITNKNNPHEVTLEDVGGAAAEHGHKPDDITCGENDDPLPLSAGGTGVKTLAALKSLIGTNAAIGIYTGDGSQKRGVNVGFIPSAIILCDEYGRVWDDTDGIVGGVAVGLYGIRSKASTSSTHATVWSNDFTALLPGEDTENSFAGFWVNQHAGSDAEENISTNKSGVVYHYIAFR